MTGTGSVSTRGTQSYIGNESICVDFYSFGTNEDGKSMIDQIISLLAHNSHNYQNHKSLELEIVVRRVVLVFCVLRCCCSSSVDQ